MAAPTQAVAVKLNVIDSGEVDPGELVIDEEVNGRRYPAKIDEMAQSLVANGQLSRVVVKRGPDNHLHVKIGFRRARAAMVVKEQKLIPGFKIRYDEVDNPDRELFLMNLAENKDREDTTVIDDANNYLRLRDDPESPMTQREIAKQVRVSDALVSRKLTLVCGTKDGKPPLSAKHQKLVHIGKIASETAYELVQMDEAARETFVDGLLGGKKATAQDAKSANVKKKKGGKQDEQKGKTLSAKAARMPFEEVVVKHGDKELTPFVTLCSIVVQIMNGKLNPKGGLRQLKQLVPEE